MIKKRDEIKMCHFATKLRACESCNLSKDKPLTRMQLWLDACPQRENPLIQKLALNMGKQQRQKRDARFIGQYPEDAPFWGTNLVR